jgi:hypothetical protein
MIRPLGALVLAAFALTACDMIDTVADEFFPPEGPAASNLPAASTRPITGKAPPLPRRRPEATSDLTLVEADPDRLVGLDFDATKALLGDPAVQLEKPPAKVWAYDGGTCMFNLFFYPSVDDKTFRVLAYEMTDEVPSAETPVRPGAETAVVKVRDKDNPILRRCFAELLQSKREPNTG